MEKAERARMGQSFILGGGMTGLAAGYVSGLPVYEATQEPGGICCSYYVRPNSTERLHKAPAMKKHIVSR